MQIRDLKDLEEQARLEVMLFSCIRSGDVKNFQIILGMSPSPNVNAIEPVIRYSPYYRIDRHGYTPLTEAIQHRNSQIIEELLKAKADVNLKDNLGDNMGYSPLEYAVSVGDTVIVKKLIELKADVNAQYLYKPPLASAAFSDNVDSVIALLEAKANLETKDNDTEGKTPLGWAVYAKSSAPVKILIDAKANLEAKDNKGRTPLGSAAYIGAFDSVKLLLEAKADTEAKDINGKTPLQIIKYVKKINGWVICSRERMDMRDRCRSPHQYRECEKLLESQPGNKKSKFWDIFKFKQPQPDKSITDSKLPAQKC